MKPGTLVRILDPEYSTLGHCAHGIILSEFSYGFEGDEPAYRVLCANRTVILMEREFEVIER